MRSSPRSSVSGDKLTTPLASCRIRRWKRPKRHTGHNGLRQRPIVSPCRNSICFRPRLPAANIGFGVETGGLQPLQERVNRPSPSPVTGTGSPTWYDIRSCSLTLPHARPVLWAACAGWPARLAEVHLHEGDDALDAEGVVAAPAISTSSSPTGYGGTRRNIPTASSA